MPNFHRQWDEEADNGVQAADCQAQHDLEAQAQTAELVPISPMTPVTKSPKSPNGKGTPTNGSAHHHHHQQPERGNTLQELYEEKVNKASGRKTNSLEVWFAGAHAGM
jgi:hypothetical protein